MSASVSLSPAIQPAAKTGPIRHLWTVDEFQRMGETGFLDPEARLELIEGELFEMAPIGSFHAGTVGILNRLFMRSVAGTQVVYVQNPIVLGDDSEPQPDIVLLRPRADYYLGAHPRAGDVLLLIEVSDSTVQFDRKTKVPLYARHGIPEVWLLDVNAGEMTVYLEPAEGQYRLIRKPTRAEAVSPTLVPAVAISLAEVLA